MTLNNAFYTDKTPPLIKDDAFTTLTEQDIAKMRSFLSIEDERIQDGEVFFYMPNSGGARNIEGDQFPQLRQISDATTASDRADRRKYERQNPDGSTTTVWEDTKIVLWYDTSVSPAEFKQVTVDLK